MVTRQDKPIIDGNTIILPIYHSNQELKYDFAQKGPTLQVKLATALPPT